MGSEQWTAGSADRLGPGLDSRRRARFSRALLVLLGMVSLGIAWPSHAEEPAPLVLRPEQVFDQRFVAFEDDSFVVYRAGARPSRTWIAYQGTDHRRLRGADFYEAIEQPELASAYTHWRATKWGLILGGAGAIGGGLYAGVDNHPKIGIAVASLGLISILAGWIINADPLDEPAAREAADDFNKQLRLSLGLPRP